jgi:hypothetical protein
MTFTAEDIAQRFRAFDCRSKGPRFDSGCPLCLALLLQLFTLDKVVAPCNCDHPAGQATTKPTE